MPAAHVPVSDDGLACLQCHTGHSMKRAVGNSKTGADHTGQVLRWNGSVIEGIGFMVLLVGILGPVIHGLLFVALSVRRKSTYSPEITGKAKSRPGLLRGWHIINAATVVFLAVTGFCLRWQLSAVPGRIAVWHGIAGGWHVVTWVLWLGFNLVTGCYVGRYLRPAAGWCGGIIRQIIYYGWGIFLGRRNPHPYEGFNPLQSVVYLLVMGLLLPVVMVSGAGLQSLRSLAFANIGSWRQLLVETHFLAGCLLLAFLSIHLYLAVWGPDGRVWRR